MTASASVLGVLVIVATLVTAVSPILLVVLWLRDRRKGELW